MILSRVTVRCQEFHAFSFAGEMRGSEGVKSVDTQKDVI